MSGRAPNTKSFLICYIFFSSCSISWCKFERRVWRGWCEAHMIVQWKHYHFPFLGKNGLTHSIIKDTFFFEVECEKFLPPYWTCHWCDIGLWSAKYYMKFFQNQIHVGNSEPTLPFSIFYSFIQKNLLLIKMWIKLIVF